MRYEEFPPAPDLRAHVRCVWRFEADAREALPKATAAERRLRAINSDARVEGVVADLTAENSEELVGGIQIILDGTDNFETRLLLNDIAISRNIPWIYAAAVGSYGVTMTIRPSPPPTCWTASGPRRSTCTMRFARCWRRRSSLGGCAARVERWLKNLPGPP